MTTSKQYTIKVIGNILLVSILLSCKYKNSDKSNNMHISLVGEIKNLPAKKIYLTNAYNWNIFIDSAEVTKDKFEFSVDSFKYDAPFLASVCIVIGANKIEQLLIFNYKRTNTNDTVASTGFMLRFGKNQLFGDYNEKFHRVSIIPNSENDLLFDLKTTDFGAVKNLKFIKETIEKNPCSYFLLNQLFQNRNLYSASELKDILTLFDKKLLISKTANDLVDYSNYLLPKSDIFPNSQLTNAQGENETLFKDSAEITIIIFWASWCGPCRLEIPQLKNIRKKFSPQLLSMKSISVDEEVKNWQRAVKEENMPWQQFLVPHNDLVKIKAQFTINSVPIVMFVDKNKHVLKRFSGYSDNNIMEYVDFINQYLTKNKN